MVLFCEPSDIEGDQSIRIFVREGIHEHQSLGSESFRFRFRFLASFTSQPFFKRDLIVSIHFLNSILNLSNSLIDNPVFLSKLSPQRLNLLELFPNPSLKITDLV